MAPERPGAVERENNRPRAPIISKVLSESRACFINGLFAIAKRIGDQLALTVHRHNACHPP